VAFDIDREFKEAVQGRKPLKALPSVVRRAMSLVWTAAPGGVVAMAVLQTALAATGVAQVVAVAKMVDGVVDSKGDDLALLPLTGLVVALVLATVARQAGERVQRLAQAKVQRTVATQVVTSVANLELEAFEDPLVFDRIQRAKAHAATYPFAVVQSVFAMAGGMLSIVAMAAAVWAISPLMLGLVVAACLPLWFAERQLAHRELGFQLTTSAGDRHRHYLLQLMTGYDEAKELRAFGSLPLLTARYGELWDEYEQQLARQVRKRFSVSVVARLAHLAVIAVAGGILVALYKNGRLGVPDVAAAVAALRLLGEALKQLVSSVFHLYTTGLFLSDFEALTIQAGGGGDASGHRPPAALEHLRVDGVTFRYPSAHADALRGVSLELRRGEVIALVGPNGSGKTTLAKLLAGLYPPAGGSITWNGTTTTDLDPAALRRSVTVLFQDFVRYKLSAADNIALADPDASHDTARVRVAARAVGAHDTVAALPNGYDTLLSREYDGGADLSVGQWQRLALARAAFRDAPLVILDEPTSAMDAITEHELFRDIRQLLRDRTVVCISHRFSTVRDADRIYVLDGGRIVEAGTHDELMAEGGMYERMFTLQAEPYLQREAPAPVS
jgi:ATP-binding cassette subfamily B protein